MPEILENSVNISAKGRGDKKNWVTSYSVSYSNDTKIWFYYKDANHLEAKVENRTQGHVSNIYQRVVHEEALH